MDLNIEKTVIRKIVLRIILFLFMIVVMSLVDRMNVSFAALKMNVDLNFSASVFGLGSGLFYLSYCLLEIPSTIIASKVGTRTWVGCLTISWGIVASLMSCTYDVKSFYILRFLQGVTEAGIAPCIFYYLSLWTPGRIQGKVFTYLMIAIPFSIVITAPISTMLLSVNWFGLAGWKWMFILEGIPSVILGVITLFYLVDHPRDAKWLSLEEKEWLYTQISKESKIKSETHYLQAMRDPKILLLCLYSFLTFCAVFGLSTWLPLILKNLSTLSHVNIGFFTAFPYLCAMMAIIPFGYYSDRTQERGKHLAFMNFVACIALALSVYFIDSPLYSYISVTIAIIAMNCSNSLFWTKPLSYMAGAKSAGSLGLITTVSTSGGLVAPYVIGLLKDQTGGFSFGILFLSATLLFASLIIYILPENKLTNTVRY